MLTTIGLLLIISVLIVLIETSIIVTYCMLRKLTKENPQIINKKLPSLTKMLLLGFIVPILAGLFIWFLIAQPWKYSTITNRDIAFIILIFSGIIGFDIYLHIQRKRKEDTPQKPWYQHDWFVRMITFVSVTVILFSTFIATATIEKNKNGSTYGTQTSAMTVLLKKAPKIEIEQIESVIDLIDIDYTITPRAHYKSVTIKIEFWTKGSTLIMEETITHKEAMLLRPYTYTYNIADKLEPEEITNIDRIVIKLIEYK